MQFIAQKIHLDAQMIYHVSLQIHYVAQNIHYVPHQIVQKIHNIWHRRYNIITQDIYIPCHRKYQRLKIIYKQCSFPVNSLTSTDCNTDCSSQKIKNITRCSPFYLFGYKDKSSYNNNSKCIPVAHIKMHLSHSKIFK